MANKERNKRSARQARARERAELQAAQEASKPADPKANKIRIVRDKPKTEAKPERAASANKGKPGFFTRAKNYLNDVRTEMHRVVWPSKTELRNYSVAVIAMLLVFGVAIWLVDTGFVALLVGFTGLRG